MYTFFSFYGGKFRAAKLYPPPRYNTIIEPFAGAAGYSQRYYDRNVILYEIDPKIFSVWDYLIRSTPQEILGLPTVVNHVDELSCCQEAKYLIGFCLNHGSAQPSKKPSSWCRSGIRPNSYWGETLKQRIASQVNNINHWKIFNESYENSPNKECTWFIDPPYNNKAGQHYKHKLTDYSSAAQFCTSRQGQVIVCENSGADWLDFRFLANIKSNESSRGKHKSSEVLWTNG